MSMERKYDIDSLIKRFQQDYIRSEANHRDNINAFKNNNPDTELPEHFLDDFNICLALKTICEEIKALKDD